MEHDNDGHTKKHEISINYVIIGKHCDRRKTFIDNNLNLAIVLIVSRDIQDLKPISIPACR